MSGESALSRAEQALVDAVRGLLFGSIEVVVHEGRIVRIERKEKVRFEADPEEGGREENEVQPLGTVLNLNHHGE